METLVGGKWSWVNAVKDLEVQGGLRGVAVNSETLGTYSFGGKTLEGTIFAVSYLPNICLILSIAKDDQAIVDAFSKVLEYAPFCTYIEKPSGFVTYEWDKKDPERRFAVLQSQGEKELRKIEKKL